MPAQNVVLVTGASSGIGREVARSLAEHGHRVFGTSRRPGTPPPFAGVEMLALDVCDDRSVAACVARVMERAGTLDVLVNNAGYELAGSAEETSLEEAKALFETNFFGMVRMVKAVLPLMRERRSGQIINVSSLAGLAAMPFMPFYTASKFAMEGYTEALRIEVKPFDVRVCAIEVGFVRTEIGKHRENAASIAAYAPWRERLIDAVGRYEENAPGPELMADAVRRIMASRAPRMHYVVGSEAKVISALRRVLPHWASEQAARRYFGLTAIAPPGA